MGTRNAPRERRPLTDAELENLDAQDPRALVAIAEASEDPVLHEEVASWRQFTGQGRPKRRGPH
jgi:hypothetical protein